MRDARGVLLGLLLVLGSPRAAQQPLTLDVLGTYTHGAFNEGAAEFAAYDQATQTLFVFNSDSDTIDLLSISDPTALELRGQVDVIEYGAGQTAWRSSIIALR